MQKVVGGKRSRGVKAKVWKRKNEVDRYWINLAFQDRIVCYGTVGFYRIRKCRFFIAIGFRLIRDQSTSDTKLKATNSVEKGSSSLFATRSKYANAAGKSV